MTRPSQSPGSVSRVTIMMMTVSRGLLTIMMSFSRSVILSLLILGNSQCVFQRPSSSGRADDASQRLEEKKILDKILDQNIYDARIRPATADTMDGPTNILVNLMIRSIDKIDDVKMEYSNQITFRQQWYDDRLEFGSKLSPKMKGAMLDGGLVIKIKNYFLFLDKIKYLTITDPGKVWMPDTFFRNERRGAMHNVLVPNLYVRIYADGL